MSYLVKEIFHTLQGEGANTGRAAVFCLFTGCNLWTGHEAQRASAVCQFCDTDFVGTDGPGGGRFADADALVDAVATAWIGDAKRRFVVCTGGEPLLQLDDDAIAALHERGFEIAIETNGTRLAPAGLDWVCVSPKAGAELVLRAGDELKVIYPQPGLDLDELAELDFVHRFLQPMDGDDRAANTEATVRYCLVDPRWRLSLQTHKYLGIP
jgi:7-carboxy-7-deazaguanine synthase (Cx14CxxC type)